MQPMKQARDHQNLIIIDTNRVPVNEPPCGKTNNVVSEQVRHRPTYKHRSRLEAGIEVK